MATKKVAKLLLKPLPKKSRSQASPPKQLTPATKPLGVTTKALPMGAAPAGRPPSNLGNYLIRPTPDEDTGFEMLNSKPELMKEVEKKFLQAKVLPTNLRPQGLINPKYTDRPQVLETNRAKNISRGFRNPRGLNS